jgi:hypothetical protein
MKSGKIRQANKSKCGINEQNLRIINVNKPKLNKNKLIEDHGKLGKDVIEVTEEDKTDSKIKNGQKTSASSQYELNISGLSCLVLAD